MSIAPLSSITQVLSTNNGKSDEAPGQAKKNRDAESTQNTTQTVSLDPEAGTAAAAGCRLRVFDAESRTA